MRPTRGILRPAGLAALILSLAWGAVLAPRAAGQGCTPIASFTGSIAPSDPVEKVRILPTAVASSCAARRPSPATTGKDHRYDLYTLTNTTTMTLCLQATLTTACRGATGIFAVTYGPAYVPADQRANYLADVGASPNGPPATYSFEVPAGATYETVVNEVGNEGCASYTIEFCTATVPVELLEFAAQ